MKYVYVVKFDWSTNDDRDCETEHFKNFNNAVERFNQIIENEKNPDFSWAADAFEGGQFNDEDYELAYYTGTDYMFWSVSKRNDGNFYSTIILTKELVK